MAEMKTAILVTKDMVISEVMEKFPVSTEIMESYGLHCVGCSANPHDTVETGAKYHGMQDSEIEAMLKELNDVIARGGGGIVKKKPVEVEEFRKNPVSLTENAARKLISVLKDKDHADFGVRVKVIAGGCSGFVYDMQLVPSPEKDDFVTESHGMRVFVDKNSSSQLKGVVVDYIETLQASGFKFQNPNSAGECGCGKSFG